MRRFIGLLVLCGSIGSTAAWGQGQTGPVVDQARMMAEMQQQMLQQFDADRDGKLSNQEQLMAQEAMRRQGWNMGMAPGGFPNADQFAKQFDRDGDGKLNQAEAMMAQAAFQRMRNPSSGGRGGVQTGGGGGALPQPAVPDPPAKEAKSSKGNPIVKRFDKDGDGKLNTEEKAAAQAELKKGKESEKEKAKEKAKETKHEKSEKKSDK